MINIERSKKGLPCMWEHGGGFTNTGGASIIGDAQGQPKQPLYIKTRGHLSCGDHALIPIQTGDVVVFADHHREDFNIEVYRITSILEEQAEIEIVCSYSMGEWDIELPAHLEEMVKVAKAKATDYHCREPYYIR